MKQIQVTEMKNKVSGGTLPDELHKLTKKLCTQAAKANIDCEWFTRNKDRITRLINRN